jgi:hypothetical protein
MKTSWNELADININGTPTMHGLVSTTPRVILGIDR